MGFKYDDEFNWNNPDHWLEIRQSKISQMQQEAFLWGAMVGALAGGFVAYVLIIII